ncbi:FAD:protein FMN transferase [Nocardioides sp. BP30]|uniref:FAD:protein FMN transferase n=1 Tax=Nocardioides sp. BP30 TaxID=3036374 RepID=UPI0024686884|nr:FAD:protein FMN transferase [Nocardioides sp. BP30]WGL51586.1 FAD:protein FMN transferase [Nocardioides sp. BP30]
MNATAGSATGSPTAAPVTRYVDHVMGMPVSLALRGRHTDDAAARDAWAEAMATLRDVDRVFSTYRSDSHVSRLDRGEISLVACPPEVLEVLALGERWRQESSGAFDVRRRGRDGELHLDPSGVVKGWAVARAARPLRHLEETGFCLSAGGDMVCAADPGAAPWRIGVEDPHDPARVVAVVPVHNGAVATSGLAHRGAHITDARTGRVPTLVASVTVIADELVEADLDATAAFALDGEAVSWLAGRRRTAVVVWADGRREVLGTATQTSPIIRLD